MKTQYDKTSKMLFRPHTYCITKQLYGIRKILEIIFNKHIRAIFYENAILTLSISAVAVHTYVFSFVVTAAGVVLCGGPKK